MPAEWALVELKWVARIYSGGTPDRSRPEFWTDGDIPWLASGCVNQWKVTEPSEYITKKGFEASSARFVPPGAVLIGLAGQGKTKGTAALSLIEATINQSVAAIVCGSALDPRFLHYWLSVNHSNIRGLSGGDLRDGLNHGHVGAIPVPLPPRVLQTRIADYLDRETATIDALIDKQTAHVGLLRERRLAAQNRAVMGLDLDSDLIDGEQVPVGWTSGPIKRVLESLDSRRVPLNADERGARQGSFPYYGASGVIDSVDDYLFDGDLVLVGEDGANLLNRSTPLAFVAYGQYWVNNHAHVLRPKFGPVEFWAARIEALDVSPVVSGSAQPKLTADALMALRISWPENPDDMARIVEVMTRETAKIDALISKAERFIELAQERRAALITAAVTGQIEIPTED
nr:restriction endonuclease subunit S [Micrococcus luteus]